MANRVLVRKTVVALDVLLYELLLDYMIRGSGSNVSFPVKSTWAPAGDGGYKYQPIFNTKVLPTVTFNATGVQHLTGNYHLGQQTGLVHSIIPLGDSAFDTPEKAKANAATLSDNLNGLVGGTMSSGNRDAIKAFGDSIANGLRLAEQGRGLASANVKYSLTHSIQSYDKYITMTMFETWVVKDDAIEITIKPRTYTPGRLLYGNQHSTDEISTCIQSNVSAIDVASNADNSAIALNAIAAVLGEV